MKIVCISDTHNQHKGLVVPDGDLLIHAGDATGQGSLKEIAAFLTWMDGLPHRHKVLVAGNHDFLFEKDRGLAGLLLSTWPRASAPRGPGEHPDLHQDRPHLGRRQQ
jgi:predicted phosphodiesterase